mmetsp:Transcript_32657/g.71852  ORF Transcript_32657/g.71852 Transcript_32657/m.71852 type:complete len:229 (-) Transcript_32657:115-801(-)
MCFRLYRNLGCPCLKHSVSKYHLLFIDRVRNVASARLISCYLFRSLNELLTYNEIDCSVKLLHVFGRYYSGSCVDCDLHTADFLVDVLHELYNKVDQLVLPHLLQVCVGNQEADVVPCHGLPAHDYELLRPLHQEACELVAQDLLDLVRLLDLYRHAHGVYRGLDKARLVLTAGHQHLVEDQLLAPPHFHLGLVVPFHGLRGEIPHTCCSRERGLYRVQIRLQRARHL